MSSFKDKLDRLHSSRRRARERAESGDESRGVFRADETEEREAPPGAPDAPDAEAARDSEEETDGASREALRFPEHDYNPSTRHGSVRLDRLRDVSWNAFLESFVPTYGGSTDAPSASEILFVDTETTGLGSDAYAFCIGWGRLVDDAFRIRHAVLTAPRGEPVALRRTAECFAESGLVCTYNGANFDLPLLERRADEHDVDADFDEVPHLDLLPVARSVCGELGAHRLADIEQNVLDFYREDDLPGAEVPGVWERYLEESDFEILDPVLRHNRLDIASLCAALPALVERHGPESSGPDRETSETRQRPASESDGDRGAVGERLARSYSLRSRDCDETAEVSRETSTSGETESGAADSGASGGKTAREGEGGEARRADASPVDSGRGDDVPGERSRRLRQRAETLLAADQWEEALPILHELIAIHPRHPYGLEKLVTLHEREGRSRLARHYRSRLRDAAPY